MALKKIPAAKALECFDEKKVLLDVRTPAEFAQGHIPGALNLPLFSNEERAEVGTLYKQVNPERAFLRGLDIAGLKMSWYVKEGFKLAPKRKVVVHCWRGGQRSGSLATLLAFAGFDVEVLEGGYKAYRKFVLEQIQTCQRKYIVLGGKTGSGKTLVLSKLAEMGEQVVDLEKLANHKGSAFGALGEAPQPTVEQFENNLFKVLSNLDANRRTWVENESRNIGKVFLPAGFFEQFKSSPMLNLEVPMEERVRYLADVYAKFSKEDLIAALLKLTKRMGGQHVKAAFEAFEAGDITAATTIALHYYDKTYLHATSKCNFSMNINMDAPLIEADKIASDLINMANAHGL